MEEFKKEEIASLLTPETDIRVKAIFHKIRRATLGMLYVYGPLFSNDMEKHLNLEANKLTYHLKILKKAGYVTNVYLPERSGRAFSKYTITDEGIKFLEYIGAKSKLDQLIHKVRNNIK